MKIAVAQLNPTVGDIAGNSELVYAAACRAREAGADLLVVSELIISGYPPKDLLLREGFVAACDRAVTALAARIDPRLGVLVGHPSRWNLPETCIGNAASLLHAGQVRHTVYKCLLPNYDVFDERRYFLPAESAAPVEFGGLRLGVHICEDAWYGEPGTSYHLKPESRRDPVAELAAAGAEVLINLSASPFEIDKPQRRAHLIARHIARHQLPFVFVNQVGGNDDLVFDGNSLVFDDSKTQLVAQLAPFETDFAVFESARLTICSTPSLSPTLPAARPRAADLLDALILGLKDYMRKSNFRDCVLGLSGGIDSALACYIAAAAVGPEYVHGLALPSRYSSEHSVSDARHLAEAIGIDFEVVPIDAIHAAYEATPVAGADLASQPAGLADQNLQARIRGALVMIRSNCSLRLD